MQVEICPGMLALREYPPAFRLSFPRTAVRCSFSCVSSFFEQEGFL
jgi:hypothetical protein